MVTARPPQVSVSSCAPAAGIPTPISGNAPNSVATTNFRMSDPPPQLGRRRIDGRTPTARPGHRSTNRRDARFAVRDGQYDDAQRGLPQVEEVSRLAGVFGPQRRGGGRASGDAGEMLVAGLGESRRSRDAAGPHGPGVHKFSTGQPATEGGFFPTDRPA